MNVTHLITGLGAGGAERMVTRLVTAPAQQGITHRVISMMDEGVFGADIRAAGVPLQTLGMTRGLPAPAVVWRLTRLLRQSKPDVLMTWLYHADFLGLVAGRLAGVPRLYWNLRCSDMDMGNYSRMSRLLLLALARLSPLPTAVVANSYAGQRHHAGLGYRPKAWHVIPNGIDLDRFRPDPAQRAALRQQLGVGEGAVLIGHVARFDVMKDHTTLLHAAQWVLEQRADAHFVLVGEGVEAENPAFPHALVSDRVHLLGRRDTIPQILAGLDLFAFSSAYGEGCPNAVAEAMACGLPCAVTDVGDARQIVGETGRVVPPRQPEALAQALLAVLDTGAGDRARLGEAARDRIVAHYSMEQAVERFTRLFSGADTP